MSESLKIIIAIYLIIINIITFIAFKVDKKLSQTHHRRISERTLLILSAIGGSLGAEFGMQLFRHKTKKLSFQLGILLLILLQAFVFHTFFL